MKIILHRYRLMFFAFLFVLLWLMPLTVFAASPSPLHPLSPTPFPDTPLWRIGVITDDLYTLDYATLAAAGVPVTTTAPAAFHLLWRGQEVALDGLGTADGIFSPGDAFVFYGQKFHGSEQDEKYTDEAVYWLTVDVATPGLRMAARSVTPMSAPAGVCTATTIAEQNLLYWGRWSTTPGTDVTWFWELVQVSTNVATRTYTLDAQTPLIAGSDVRLVVEVAARNSNTAAPDHHLRLRLNDNALGDRYWDGAVGHIITVTAPASALRAGENTLSVGYVADVVRQEVYFDRATLTYRQTPAALNGAWACVAAQEGAAAYTVAGLSDAARLYDVSDPLQPVALAGYALTDGVLTLADNAPQGTVYRAAAPASVAPTPYTPDPNLIASPTGADEIIVAPHEFFVALAPLVAQRRAQGLRVQVVDVADVYAAFNDGVFHPEAIRALVRHAYDVWPGQPPRYLLLVGDGNFNFKGYNPERYGEFIPSRIPPYLAFADPTQGEVPVDAHFGDLDGDDFPEVVVGRIPAADAAEVSAFVAKLLDYEAQPPADWQLHTLLVADNVPDDAGDFQGVMEDVRTTYIHSPLTATTVYLNDYCGAPTSVPKPCPTATFALTTTWSAGAGVMAYTGHGSVNRWAHEKLLTTGDIATFAPGHGLPFVLSLDCLDGFWMFPENYPGLDDARSIAERLLTTPERGAVAAFSPAGLGYTWDGELVANAVFTALTHHGEFRVAELSQLGRAASRTHMRKVYTLFGDPALVLPFGERITLTPITLTVGSRVTVDAFAPRLDTRFGQTLPFTATAWTADAGAFDRDGAYVAPTTAGAARVTAHLGPLSAAAPVTVLAGPPVTLTVSPDPLWLLPGESAQMTATIRDAYLNPVAYTGVITWTSDIGSITPAGRFTAPGLKTEGLITATAAISQGSNTVWLSNHARVTIVASRVYLPLVTK